MFINFSFHWRQWVDPHTADLWEDGGGWRWGRFSYWAGEVFRLFVVHAAAFISIFFCLKSIKAWRQGKEPCTYSRCRLDLSCLVSLGYIFNCWPSLMHFTQAFINGDASWMRTWSFAWLEKNANILCQQNSSCGWGLFCLRACTSVCVLVFYTPLLLKNLLNKWTQLIERI